MKPDRTRLSAIQILSSIERIEGMVGSLSFDQYLARRDTRDIVKRHLLIVSEASRRVSDESKARPSVRWPKIAALGNVLRHQYDNIDQQVIWDIIRADLPDLKQVATELIEEAERSANRPRMFTGDTLVIATHNPGKLREIAELLGPYVPAIVSAGELGLPEPEETGATFVENAELKARAAAAGSGRIALADDSGLAVHALGGEPGIYSARWAGPGKNFGHAMERVQQELGADPDRRAHFVCALSLAWPDGHCETVEGVIHGSLVWPARGDRGFGYDPMFVADGFDVTFGEMEPELKHRISHRADAFKKLVARCFDR